MSREAPSFILRKMAWATGTYGATVAIRLGTNVVLSRLLTPDIFGIMVIVNSIRYGIDLLIDVGIEQNIIHSKNGLKPEFLNTAWTLQIARGVCLALVFALLSPVLSEFYKIDVRILLLMSAAPFLYSLSSTAVFTTVKKLEVQKKNAFELTAELLGFVTYVVLALISPTVWSVVLGTLIFIGIRSALSYRLEHPAHALIIVPDYARQILRFGKWIMIASVLAYAASNLDRIYLGKVMPLGLLGVYGLAKTISDLPPILANRLSYQIVFPYLADTHSAHGVTLRDIEASRWRLVLLSAIAMSVGIAWADWAIAVVYDVRYHQAGWMLSMLLIASWISGLSNLNEANALGSGQPVYNTLSNAARVAGLAVGLPLGFVHAGLSGAIIVIIASEVLRYIALVTPLGPARSAILKQDAAASALVVAVVLMFWVIRHFLGLGTAWSGFLSGSS